MNFLDFFHWRYLSTSQPSRDWSTLGTAVFSATLASHVMARWSKREKNWGIGTTGVCVHLVSFFYCSCFLRFFLLLSLLFFFGFVLVLVLAVAVVVKEVEGVWSCLKCRFEMPRFAQKG